MSLWTVGQNIRMFADIKSASASGQRGDLSALVAKSNAHPAV